MAIAALRIHIFPIRTICGRIVRQGFTLFNFSTHAINVIIFIVVVFSYVSSAVAITPPLALFPLSTRILLLSSWSSWSSSSSSLLLSFVAGTSRSSFFRRTPRPSSSISPLAFAPVSAATATATASFAHPGRFYFPARAQARACTRRVEGRWWLTCRDRKINSSRSSRSSIAGGGGGVGAGARAGVQGGNTDSMPVTAECISAAATTRSPPSTRREEDRFVLAGKLPLAGEGASTTDEERGNAEDATTTTTPPKTKEKKPLQRQSESSPNPLLDPPIPVPDPYGWMRSDDRSSSEVMDHLRAENAHTESVTSHLSNLRDELYKELVRSIRETDYTVPSKSGPFLYYRRTYEGKSYGASCRAPLSCPTDSNDDDDDDDDDNKGGGGGSVTVDVDARWMSLAKKWDGTAESPILPGEHLYLDENALAEGKDYCSVGQIRVSPNHTYVAYTVDYKGNEKCNLYVKEIDTERVVDFDANLECDGTVVWGNDETSLFYLKMDDTQRPYQVYRRRIVNGNGHQKDKEATEGAKVQDDELLFQENDELFWVHAWKSFNQRYLFVSSKSKETSEVHFLDLANPASVLRCIARRRTKVLYSVTHVDGTWLITTNVGGTPNMRLMACPAVPDSEDMWTDVVDPDGEAAFSGSYARSLDSVTAFSSHVVTSGREGGIPRVWVAASFDGNKKNDDNNDAAVVVLVADFVRLSFDQDAYDVRLSGNLEYDARHVVLTYDSLVVPPRSIRVNMSNVNDRIVLKEKDVPGYDASLFGCERTVALSRDGTTEIPVSIVYKKDVMEKALSEEGGVGGRSVGGANVHLYGYGSYGACVEASFRSSRLPLLERGVIYAIAHVRGGGEMGRQWYEEPNGAKYLCKKNTFNDFVDVANWLVDERKLTTPEKLSCEGRSAGGLLIGGSVNQAPELFKVAILAVPFVDVVCTMIDASIPLTVAEWEEWGNPNEKKFFDYMMEYSPINNVKSGATYPSCLLTGGLHDPRVQYWEPAKFAAELRHTQGPESGPVCVKIDMSAGHFSASDRYKYLRELAFDYAFLLDQLGLASVVPKGE